MRMDKRVILLGGTLTLCLSAANVSDNLFIISNPQSKIEYVKSSSNDYESLGDSNSDVYRFKDIYDTKQSNKGIITKSLDLFGDMRNLTEEEEVSYSKGLDRISEETGVTMF